MLYPGAFEPFPRGTCSVVSFRIRRHNSFPTVSEFLEVHLPSVWGLEYEDVTLATSDKVKIRAYLLLHSEKDSGDLKYSIDYSASLEHS